ncbi:hypothetical protein BGX33_002601 [Mortierella sp. NVP41]|nr:hypothetical protein BGX33_002601 [Mortierella sp. NVP41]
MTEETQLEYEEEYYDEEEGEEYNEAEDADYDYNEEGGQDGDIQVGQEIDLTHEEVWDDSALIEAWDMAVKQYEVYHSKANPKVNPKDKIAKSAVPVSLSKHKNTDSTPQPSTTPTKRTKLNHGGTTATAPNGSTTQPTRSELDSSPTPTVAQTQPAQGPVTSQYDVSERKPSFKKADKPTFNHHKERQEEYEKEKAKQVKGSTASVASLLSTATNAPAAAAPVLDAATIAYYQQLGYYYDPSYASAHGTEATPLDEEQEQDRDEEDHALDLPCITHRSPSIHLLMDYIPDSIPAISRKLLHHIYPQERHQPPPQQLPHQGEDSDFQECQEYQGCQGWFLLVGEHQEQRHLLDMFHHQH